MCFHQPACQYKASMDNQHHTHHNNKVIKRKHHLRTASLLQDNTVAISNHHLSNITSNITGLHHNNLVILDNSRISRAIHLRYTQEDNLAIMSVIVTNTYESCK